MGRYTHTNASHPISHHVSPHTVSDLEKMIGVSLLPGLSQKIRDAGMDLPKPSSQRGKGGKNKEASKAPEEFTLREFSRSILGALERAIK